MRHCDPIDALRKICFACPEATEQETWGNPTFRVRGKIFAMPRIGDGRMSVWCKAPAHSQEILIAADPDRFFAPPYVGPKGWIGIWLDPTPDWQELGYLIRRSYRLIAPKRLAATMAEE